MIVVYYLLTCLCGYLMTLARVPPTNDLAAFFSTRRQVRKPKSTLAEVAITDAAHGLIETELVQAKINAPLADAIDDTKADAQDDARTSAPTSKSKTRVIGAMAGATGAMLGIRLLEKLRPLDVETHLVMNKWVEATIAYETDHKDEMCGHLLPKCTLRATWQP